VSVPPWQQHLDHRLKKVNWVEITLGADAKDADHFISPEERLRIAMAKGSIAFAGRTLTFNAACWPAVELHQAA